MVLGSCLCVFLSDLGPIILSTLVWNWLMFGTLDCLIWLSLDVDAESCSRFRSWFLSRFQNWSLSEILILKCYQHQFDGLNWNIYTFHKATLDHLKKQAAFYPATEWGTVSLYGNRLNWINSHIKPTLTNFETIHHTVRILHLIFAGDQFCFNDILKIQVVCYQPL